MLASKHDMKHILLTTIAAVLLVGCGPSVDIHQAAETGNIEAVKQHLADGADVNAKDRWGETPLHVTDNKEIAELLIAKGADVNAQDGFRRTPLHHAAHEGHREVAELLIAEGADVNETNGSGETPLNWAKKELTDLLRKHGGKTGEELKAEGK
jgi:ankyrin repeat protein